MTALDLLLEIDLRVSANMMGFRAPEVGSLITEKNLYSIINEIERLLLEGNEEKKIANICGLVWTHFGEEFDLLSGYIYSVMSAIGFSPVGSMLKSSDSQTILTQSILPMFESELNSLRHSVLLLDTRYRLTGFQMRLWTALESADNIAISAPTSAGKSFLICLNAIWGMRKRGGTSIYIVPTLTLMNQVANDLLELCRRLHQKFSIETNIEDNPDPEIPRMYVLTQERLLQYAELFKNSTSKLNFLIVDEVQNIERAFEYSEKDVRAKLLLDTVIDIHDRFKPAKTVISGPRISDIELLGTTLFRKPCVPIVAESSPVANICYSIHPYLKGGERILIRQYSELRSKHRELVCKNVVGATGFGKSAYSDSFLAYLEKVVGANDNVLIFSPTTSQCRKTALHLRKSLPKTAKPIIQSLAEYIRSTVSKHYDLATCVEHRVAFHHGKIPNHIRNALEFAISKSLFKRTVCTTTLMQGVNIPAKSVVLRNPNLFIRAVDGVRPILSNYEIANLRGRAGRLLRDFVGRTFILDGTSFEESEVQASLFQPAEKTVEGGYSKVFSENREEIMESLTRDSSSQGGNSLASYIANIVYTEDAAVAMLRRKGVSLSSSEYLAITKKLAGLTVERSVCRKFRYWSPFDLDLIYQQRRRFNLPNVAFAANAGSNICDALSLINAIVPGQWARYLGETSSNEKLVWVLSTLAIRWAKEEPLKSLLSDAYPQVSSDNTDKTISMLQRTIGYGLPAILSPIYAMLQPESPMLASIERGAMKSGTVILLNNNIPRETAIAISLRMERAGVQISEIGDVLRFLKKRKLEYWDAVQFRQLADMHEISTMP